MCVHFIERIPSNVL